MNKLKKSSTEPCINDDKEVSTSLSHLQPLFINLKILNVYQINIYLHLIFMYKINNDTMPNIFKTLFKKIQHKYLTRHASNNYIQAKTHFETTKFSVIARGPQQWSIVVRNDIKTHANINIFKSKLKEIILINQNMKDFFQSYIYLLPFKILYSIFSFYLQRFKI